VSVTTQDVGRPFLPPDVVALIESTVGAGLDAFGSDPIPVIGQPPEFDGLPLVAIRLDRGSLLSARNEWLEALRPVMTDMHADMLFSTYGAYELARLTQPYGQSAWGPVFFFFGDASTWKDPKDTRVVRLGPDDLADVDYSRFWHCYNGEAHDGYGVIEDGELVALAGVIHYGEGVDEIGMDVMPEARGAGLGRAVVGAAGSAIIERGNLALATTSPWNIPSARTLRSAGLRYSYSLMMSFDSFDGAFPMPAQPLGRPYPGARMVNYYPYWAMNQDVEPRSDM
jgi:GNAT superfamily N-acetyltransferase